MQLSHMRGSLLLQDLKEVYKKTCARNYPNADAILPHTVMHIGSHVALFERIVILTCFFLLSDWYSDVLCIHPGEVALSCTFGHLGPLVRKT